VDQVWSQVSWWYRRRTKSPNAQASREIVGTLFNAECYKRKYLDSRESVEDCWTHFEKFGAASGYDPNCQFDTDWYLAQYPEVARLNQNPLLHYVLSGADEGKDPNPFFSTSQYLEDNPDVKALGINPLEHFLEFGYDEGRNPFRNYWPEKIRPWKVSSVPAFPNANHLHRQIALVIPVFNNWFATERCLRALHSTPDIHLVDIIVVNDKSTDETLLQLQRFPSIRVISTPANMGFTRACNYAVEKLKDYKFIYLLNNDTEVIDGFLSNSVELMNAHPEAALVGSTFYFPDGSLQECGAIVWSDGSSHHFGRGDILGSTQFIVSRRVDYCSGAGILIRNDLLSEVGLFDDRYAPAYYEDTDLSFKLRKLGYEVWVCAGSKVIHYEGLSSGTDTELIIDINRKKFCSKWKTELLDHHDKTLDPHLVLRAAMRQNKYADSEIVLELTKLLWGSENS
jgi:GT2 family glycosyltransferase